jgi:hypothetical protein
MASDGWGPLVDEYGEHNPRAGRDLAALAGASGTRSNTARLAERMAMEISEPIELRQPESKFADQAPAAQRTGQWQGMRA